MPWTRTEFSFSGASHTGMEATHNLLGGFSTDPAVMNLIAAGTPELQAYNAETVSGIGVTLERVHMIWNTVFQEDQQMSWGIVKWTPTEAKVPFPSPFDDANSVDWLAWGRVYPTAAGSSHSFGAATSNATHVFDIRSKRKITEHNQTFHLVMQLSRPLTPATNIETVKGVCSTLIKGAYS